MLEFLVIWFVCGLIAGAIYRSKGKSELMGFLAGALLGPLGIVLTAVAQSNRGGIERQAVRSGEMKRCPYCAELIKQQAIVCRYCGRGLVAKTEAARTCPYCKQAVGQYDTHCRSCHAEL